MEIYISKHTGKMTCIQKVLFREKVIEMLSKSQTQFNPNVIQPINTTKLELSFVYLVWMGQLLKENGKTQLYFDIDPQKGESCVAAFAKRKGNVGMAGWNERP